MNEVKILFFANLRDAVGARSIQMELPAETTIAELKDKLVDTHPGLSFFRNSIMAAINHEYVADEQHIPPEAEIAFFPPVSGG